MSGHSRRCCAGTVEAFLPTHEVYITDWSDARMVPLTEGRFDLDDYVDYVIEMLHVLGRHIPSSRYASLGAGGAAVSVMEAQHDPWPLSMTRMGGPIDTRPIRPRQRSGGRTAASNGSATTSITKVPFPHAGVMRDVFGSCSSRASSP